jgi:hypothetical protein
MSSAIPFRQGFLGWRRNNDEQRTTAHTDDSKKDFCLGTSGLGDLAGCSATNCHSCTTEGYAKVPYLD